MKKRILTVSSAYILIGMGVDRIPEAGEVLPQHGSVFYAPGGAGTNTAVALAKLGAESVFCARIGRDPHGETLYDYYKDSGVDVSHLAIDRENPTGCTVHLSVEGEEETRVVRYPGANLLLSESDVDNAFACCPDALCLQADVGDAALLYAADYAARHEIPIFFDAGHGRRELPLEKLPPLKVFCADEGEMETYTGVLPRGADSCLAATMELLHRIKTEYVVIKLGDRGAFVCNGRHFKFHAAFPVKDVHQGGAGDGFFAALSLRLLDEGTDVTEAMRYATAVGSMTVMREGEADALPDAGEVERFLESYDTM